MNFHFVLLNKAFSPLHTYLLKWDNSDIILILLGILSISLNSWDIVFCIQARHNILENVLTYAKTYQSLTVLNVPMKKTPTLKIYLFKQLHSPLNHFFSDLFLKLFFFQCLCFIYTLYGAGMWVALEVSIRLEKLLPLKWDLKFSLKVSSDWTFWKLLAAH